MEPVVQGRRRPGRLRADRSRAAGVDQVRERRAWPRSRTSSPAGASPEHVRLHLDHVPVIDEDGLQRRLPAHLPRGARPGLRVGDDRRLAPAAGGEHPRHAPVAALAHAPACRWRPSWARCWGTRPARCRPTRSCSPRARASPTWTRRGASSRETGCDWLSVAIGNIHGAIAAARKDQKKVAGAAEPGAPGAAEPRPPGSRWCCTAARASSRSNVRAAVQRGIAKINVGTEIRQPYEASAQGDRRTWRRRRRRCTNAPAGCCEMISAWPAPASCFFGREGRDHEPARHRRRHQRLQGGRLRGRRAPAGLCLRRVRCAAAPAGLGRAGRRRCLGSIKRSIRRRLHCPTAGTRPGARRCASPRWARRWCR